MIFIAVVWSRCEASAGLVLVLELAVAGASVKLRTVGIVGDALHVERAGGDLEATGAADLTLRRGEGDGHGEKNRFEKHCEELLIGVCRVEMVLWLGCICICDAELIEGQFRILCFQ